MAKPEVLNILVDTKYKNELASLSPTISWDYYDQDGDAQDSYSLKIGSSRGKSDILNTGIVLSSLNQHVVTTLGYDSELKYGLKYYITLSVSNTYGSSVDKEDYFFTTGNYWDNYVDNIEGWTMEFFYKMDSLSQSISSFDEDLYPHHDLEVKDGTYSMSVEFFVDRVLVKTSETSTYFIDTTKFHLYRLTGEEDDIKFYVDGILALNVLGKNTIQTSESSLKISSAPNGLPVESTWGAFLIDSDGAFPPETAMKTSEISSLFFDDEEAVDFLFDNESNNKLFVATNPTDVTESGKIYSVSKNAYRSKYMARPVVAFEANKVMIDNNMSKWVSTKDEIFEITGDKVSAFTFEAELSSESNLINFSKTENCVGVGGVFNNFLRIDTVSEGVGKVWNYQTTKNSGNSWFANVENGDGWTIDFKIRIADDNDSTSETSGLTINDGKYEETIYFFENRVVFSDANVTAFHDFSSSFVEARVTGKNNDIFLYVKDGDSWVLLIDGTGLFLGEAQSYADCSAHSLATISDQRSYAVWHSNKSGGWQIYLSEYNGSSWGAEKQLTYDNGNRSEPSIAIDSNNIAHIVYQDDQFGNNEIVYIKYNGYGVFEKNRITDSVGDSIEPKIAIDSSDNIFIVWLDNRLGNYHVYSAKYIESEEKWYSSHSDEEDIRISGFGSSYDASNLSIASSGTEIAVIWQDDRNSFGDIYFSYYAKNKWVIEHLVSDASYGASNPDIEVDSSGKYHFVWQDIRFGNPQIYYRSYFGSFLSSVRISSSSNNSKYPAITAFTDSDSDLNILWLEGVSGSNSINMLRTIDGVFNSTTESLQTSSFNNILSIDSASFSSKKEMQVVFSSNNNEGFDTIYSFNLYTPKTTADQSADVSSSSIVVSNSRNTKSITFGNISSISPSVSEWYYLKYYTGSSVKPIIINSWDADNLVDFFIDGEKNLYIIDNSGLKIYSMVLSGSSLTQNEHTEKASIQSPSDPEHVFVDSFGNIYVSSGDKIYYHYHLSSPIIDEDHQWMEIDNEYSIGNIRSINEDSETGNIWIGFDEGAISFSASSIFKNNILKTSNSDIYASGLKVNGFSFSNDYIYVATDGGIVKINRQNDLETTMTVEDGLLDQEINSIQKESDSVIWAIGDRGLVKIEGETITIFRKKLSSDYINGFVIDQNNNLWLANNLGIDFFDPSTLCYYLIDSKDGLISLSSLVNYKSYKIITDDDLDRQYYHIVKVNGTYRSSSSYYFDSNNKIVIFDSALTSSDIVELIYFEYVKLLFNLSDPTLMLEISFTGAKRITGLANGSFAGQVVASFILNGDSYVYKFSSSSLEAENYPFGTVIYDKTPPIGTIDISDQVSANQVVLSLSASDSVSGVENMVISRYSNFTSDGSAPITPIPFAESANYDLGSTIGVGTDSHSFVGSSGSVLHIFERSTNSVVQTDLYAGSSNVAQIYKFDKTEREWNNVENLSAEQILCMETHLGKVYVGTGDSGKIFVSSDGDNYSVLTQLSDSYVYSMASGTDDKLYIGTGTSGKLYMYDGESVTLLFDFNEDGIYSLTEFSGFIYMGTGDKGRIYRYNMANGSSEIAFDDSDIKILSLGVGRDYGTDSDTVYAGTNSNGRILRLVASRDIFVKSFESIYSNCYSIKEYSNSSDGSTNDLYACVDSRLMKLGKNSWSVSYIDDSADNIKDVAVFNGEIFIISSGKVKSLSLNVDKYVYVKFIDYAGNETVLFDSDGELKPKTETERLYDILTAEDVAGFSLKNRILVVDSSASVMKTISGNRPFLSVGRIDQETAVYTSEVFNGTNNLIAWDKISYSGTVPTGTAIEIRIRSSEVESAIDNEDWSDVVASGQSINGTVGQYIQFKVKLSSSVRGITPVLHNVTITSKSTFAVHYFTTNFALSSNLKSGIITANTVTPTGTELIFGVTSGTSVDWNDYQIIELNKVFYTDENNSDKNIKIGVKFLSTTDSVARLDEFGIMFTTDSGELVKLNLN